MLNGKLLTPRYWSSWLLIGLFRLFAFLPWRLQLPIGRFIGRAALKFAKRRREITQHNIALCFPDLSAAERERLVSDHFASLGIGLVEAINAWWKSAAWICRHMREGAGREYLEAALAQGRGALMLTAHFMPLDLCARGGQLMGNQLIANPPPFYAVYRRHENPVFDRVISTRRTRKGGRILHQSDFRSLLRALHEGGVVWFAPDQGYLGPHGVEAPFFGVPAPTTTVTARLAKLTGSPVLPFFVERLPDAKSYRLSILPALENFPSDDPIADATRVNAALEVGIRRVPDQYLWCHDRFKHFRRGSSAQKPGNSA